MPELGAFAEIAPYLTHPLVLAGFALLLFFGLLRALLKSKIMPTVSQRAGGQALMLLLRYGFLIALVVIVLGFALVFLREAQADPLSRWGALGGALFVSAGVAVFLVREARQPSGVSSDLLDRAMAALRQQYEAQVMGLEQQRRTDQDRQLKCRRERPGGRGG